MSRDEEDKAKAGYSFEPHRAEKPSGGPAEPQEGGDYDRAQNLGRMLLVQKFGDAAQRDNAGAARTGHPSGARARGLRLLQQKAEKMRRESESTVREDTHDAAARGIASPAISLPHAERIQASFGSAHDVSKIKAHVGGDSASAMGAKAYATGEHVVFDQQPDLHTASHEAAHVVQQSHGVQLYGGVGQEGDSYERNADDVADRVVAGESASELLGGSVPRSGATSAIQHKKRSGTKDGARESKDVSSGKAGAESQVDPDDKVMARAMVTGFRAAQHELDKPGGTVADAFGHLLHVGNVSPEYQGTVDHEVVTAAADSFDLSLRRMSQKQPEQCEGLRDLNERIRGDIGLGEPTKRGTNLASGSDASYASAAVGPALDALAAHTQSAVRFLEDVDSDDQQRRQYVVETIAGDIDFTSGYVRKLLADIPAEQRHSLANAAEPAALAVGKALRWVRTRPAHERLEAKLLRGIALFDSVLDQIGAEKIEARDAAPLSERGKHGQELEVAEFNDAWDKATGAIESFAKRQQKVISLFEGLAGLEDQPQPDFKAALLQALIDSTLSTAISSFAKALATSPALHMPQAAKTIGFPAPEHKGGDGLSSAFNIGLGSLKTAITSKLASQTNVDARKRALHYFCYAMGVSEDARADAYKKNLRELKKRSAITASQLRDVAYIVTTKTETLADQHLQEITKAWASYLAQSHLGTRGVGSDKTSNMKDYFGVHRPGGRVFGTSHAGGDGVLSVLLRIEGDAAKPTLDASMTKIVGINSELESHVLVGANHEFDKVELPKEVHVEAGFARATIALDEKNRIRDVLNWHEMQRHVGGMSAAGFWQLWGKHLKLS